MRVVFESKIAIVTYIAGRLLYTDKTTALQHRSRRTWKNFEIAKTAYGELTSSDWDPPLEPQ
jgi:hypothetical protein